MPLGHWHLHNHDHFSSFAKGGKDTYICQDNGDCDCKEGLRCVQKELDSSPFSLGCKMKDGNDFSMDHFLKADKARSKCIQNAEEEEQPKTVEVELDDMDDTKMQIQIRYPMPQLASIKDSILGQTAVPTASGDKALGTGNPSSAESTFLDADEWKAQFEQEKANMTTIMDNLHQKISESEAMMADGKNELDHATAQKGENLEDLDADQKKALHEVKEDMKIGLEYAVGQAEEFQNFQTMCKGMQKTAQKLIPYSKEVGFDRGLNCYLDHEEKQALEKMWEEIGAESAQLAQVPIDARLAAPLAALMEPRNRRVSWANAHLRQGRRGGATACRPSAQVRRRIGEEFLVALK